MPSFTMTDVRQADEAAQWVLDALGDRKVLLLEGQLGAGKTTLSAAICRALGSTDVVSSPTFSIVQEYDSPAGSIYHLDLYRLKDTAEAYAAGIEDILHSGSHCLVEWPEKIVPLLPESYSVLTIQTEGNIRHLDLQHYG